MSSTAGRAPGRLPSGRHKLSREFVVSSQRDRMLDAMAEACAEKGYGQVSVADVVSRASVSRATFYEMFGGKEDCFLAAYDAILGNFMGSVVAAYQSEESWPDQVRAGIGEILTFMAAEPAFARMCMVEVLAAGPLALERYLAAARLFASLLDEGRTYAPERANLPSSLPRAVVGGGELAIRDAIISGRTERLPELLPDLLYAALAPFLGRDQALEAARRAAAG